MSEVKTIVGLLTLAPASMKTASGESCRHVLLESEIGNVIREAGMHAVSGGDPYPEEDRIATSCSLARRSSIYISCILHGGRRYEIL